MKNLKLKKTYLFLNIYLQLIKLLAQSKNLLNNEKIFYHYYAVFFNKF